MTENIKYGREKNGKGTRRSPSRRHSRVSPGRRRARAQSQRYTYTRSVAEAAIDSRHRATDSSDERSRGGVVSRLCEVCPVVKSVTSGHPIGDGIDIAPGDRGSVTGSGRDKTTFPRPRPAVRPAVRLRVTRFTRVVSHARAHPITSSRSDQRISHHGSRSSLHAPRPARAAGAGRLENVRAPRGTLSHHTRVHDASRTRVHVTVLARHAVSKRTQSGG